MKGLVKGEGMVTENNTLELKNLICFEGSLFEHEIQTVLDDMKDFVEGQGASEKGKIITVNSGVRIIRGKPKIEIKILYPITSKIEGNKEYQYLERYTVSGCLHNQYIGNPMGVNMVILELDKYIADNELTVEGVMHQMITFISPTERIYDLYIEVSKNDC